MKTISLISSVVISCALLTGNAFATSQLPVGSSSDMQQSKQNNEKQKRANLSYQIVKKWGGHVLEAYGTSPKIWAKEMVPLFRASSMDIMQRAANAKTFDAMNGALLQGNNATATKAGSTKSLGSTTYDLVYVPVTACRIFDTRLTTAGAIAPATARNFSVTNNTSYASQGGEASDCSGAGVAGDFAAAVINFTVVNPTSQGFVTAYPLGTTRPLASTMVHAPGALLSNTSIVRLDQGVSGHEMSVYSSGGTHLVGDIVGYFIEPEATALECEDTSDNSQSIAPGSRDNVVAPSCPNGYFQTATNCIGARSMPIIGASGGVCGAENNGTINATLFASRTCCRVPGR